MCVQVFLANTHQRPWNQIIWRDGCVLGKAGRFSTCQVRLGRSLKIRGSLFAFGQKKTFPRLIVKDQIVLITASGLQGDQPLVSIEQCG